MKLFLSSEGVPRPDLLRKLLGVSDETVRVALINNAQDVYPPELAKQRKDLLIETFESLGFQAVFVDLREYDEKDDRLALLLKSCKLIWVAGGNVFWLRHVMHTSGFDKLIKPLLSEGIVYGGWSAGAVVMGPSLRSIELMDDPNVVSDVIWDGLGITDFFVWPHWDKEKYRHLQEEGLKKMEQLPYKTILLKDGDLIIIDGDRRKIVT